MNPITMSATDAKVQFGKVIVKVKKGQTIIIEKNKKAEMVCISIDDYEDFLEIKDEKFQKNIKKSKIEIEKGGFGTMDDLYAIHRKTIAKEGAKL
jgi:PHD/YefM family antitoxin component YafN of YafNO toxin-antitoxin module